MNATCMIYGATGVTGSLLVAELMARGVRPVLAGRDAVRLAALAERWQLTFIATSAANLAPHVANVTVLVNCAGPFAGGLGGEVVAAAIRARVPYLDCAGEPSFVRELVEQYGAAAEAAAICILPAAAFEASLGDWAAECAIQQLRERCRAVHIGYAFADGSVTPGTYASITGELLRPSVVWERDRWVTEAHGSHVHTLDFGAEFGGPRRASSLALAEVVMIPRRHRVDSVRSYVALGMSRRAEAHAMAAPGSKASWSELGMRALLQSSAVVRALGGEALVSRALARLAPVRTPRPDARFSIVAEAVGASGHNATVRVSGGNPYALSAQLLADTVIAWLVAPPTLHGVRSPAEIFDAAMRLSAFERAGSVQLTTSFSRESSA